MKKLSEGKPFVKTRQKPKASKKLYAKLAKLWRRNFYCLPVRFISYCYTIKYNFNNLCPDMKSLMNAADKLCNFQGNRSNINSH